MLIFSLFYVALVCNADSISFWRNGTEDGILSQDFTTRTINKMIEFEPLLNESSAGHLDVNLDAIDYLDNIATASNSSRKRSDSDVIDIFWSQWNIFTIADSIAAKFKASLQKTQCVGRIFWLDLAYNGQRRTFLVDIDPYTTGGNCDTTATASAISHVLQRHITQIYEQRYSEFCNYLTNNGTWSTTVRVQLWEDGGYSNNNVVVQIPCTKDMKNVKESG